MKEPMTDTTDWKIFLGDGKPDGSRMDRLPEPPPWRHPTNQYEHRGNTYKATPHEIQLVNAALYLRRPLLVTGAPGSGKSSLAYAVAMELELGSVLKWPINSRSTLRQGLYEYDAIGRLRDVQEQAYAVGGKGEPNGQKSTPEQEAAYWKGIGNYVRLGPLGTALYSPPEVPEQPPSTKVRPRVLLIDEIDKSDIDFPNDLLNVLEEGNFEIPELARIAAKAPLVDVLAFAGDYDAKAEKDAENSLPTRAIAFGRVQCRAFPFIVITSNGERELPPAFLRRCIRLDIKPLPDAELREIVAAHFRGADNAKVAAHIEGLLQSFKTIQKDGRMIAIDQLLNTLFLLTRETPPTEEERKALMTVLMRALDEG